MFKNLVSNLPYSPALISQVGFYARRLRQEEATRRLGLAFTALAVVAQSFAVFSPPEAQAQANMNNVVYEGVTSQQQLVDVLNRGTDSAGRSDIRQIYQHFGVTVADIQNGRVGTINSRDFDLGIWSIGRLPWDGGTDHERAVPIPNTGTTVYARKLHRFDRVNINNGSTYKAVIGTRAVDGKWFAIIFDCGNLTYVDLPTTPVEPPRTPQPTPLASCSSLQIIAVAGSRNQFTLKAQAKAEGGASISGYDFRVEDSDGQTVADKTVRTSSTSGSTELTVPEDGNFTARVNVSTSLGNKTGSDCTKALTVTPEPRCPYNIDYPASDGECKPCPDSGNLWYKDPACKAELVPSKTVKNLSAGGGNANDTIVKPGDTLEYSLRVTNTGRADGRMDLRENLADVLEYADVKDLNGGRLDEVGQASQRYVSWPAMTIKPGETEVRTVTVLVKSEIPAAPQNAGNPESYNCVMTNSFGTTVNTRVECPAPKLVENTVQSLPKTGPGANVAFAGILLMVVSYFYARSRQLGREVRIVRKEFAAGSL